MKDKISHICELLLGAAHADDKFEESEKATIRNILAHLLEGELPPELSERIESFEPAKFDLNAGAAPFVTASLKDKQRLLHMIGAVHESDDEFDFAEDEYVRQVADALGVHGADRARFTIEYEDVVAPDDLAH